MPLDAKRKTQNAVRALVPLLLSWFSANARDLPWRRTRDPYAIWVSEIMLQQTQVKTVIPYWERWMRELPTIESAAQASPAKLHKLWEGLGYYTRVRNLQRAAQQIVAGHGGQFPEDFEILLALPGIGRYTAGAIASIAFNQPRPILDGNVIRVLTRVFGIAGDPREKSTNGRLWRLAEDLVVHAKRNTQHAAKTRSRTRTRTKDEDDQSCSALNQSLMELGALVCTPRSPRCEACPVNKLCIARKRNLQEKLPNLGKPTGTTARCFIAFIVERNGKFLVCQRPDGVVNAHLWEFPNIEIGNSKGRARQSPARRSEIVESRRAWSDAPCSTTDFRVTSIQPLCTIKHSITRYRITTKAHPARLANSRFKPDGQWLTLPQLHKLAFTSAHKKILARLDG